VLVERRFSRKIKSVQTDWGGEYCKLNNFFQTIDIHHRLICHHTHEQNGSVERRRRHTVETSLTLLGQCSAPLQFWNYVLNLPYLSSIACLLLSSKISLPLNVCLIV